MVKKVKVLSQRGTRICDVGEPCQVIIRLFVLLLGAVLFYDVLFKNSLPYTQMRQNFIVVLCYI